VSTKYIISLIFLTFHIPPNLAEVPPHKKAECNMTTYIISLYSNVHNIQYKAIVYFWFVWNYYCTGNSKAIVGASCPLKDFAGWREKYGAVFTNLSAQHFVTTCRLHLLKEYLLRENCLLTTVSILCENARH